MFISKKKFEIMEKKIRHCQEVARQLNDIAVRQNRLITKQNEEIKHCQKLIELYESCLKQGVQVNFPDVTGRAKGGADIPVNNNNFD